MTLETKGCHVADNALHRSSDMKIIQNKIRKDTKSFTRFSVPAMSNLACKTSCFAALVLVSVGIAIVNRDTKKV